MGFVWMIIVLSWADIIASYALFQLMTYLTTVWNLNLTDAAKILNIWNGVAAILPLGFAFLVDSFLGKSSMLLLSSVAYSIGLGFLSMSTPPVLSKSTNTCSQYQPECIGNTQKVLFYTALALIAIGMSGHTVSLDAFLDDQKEGDEETPSPNPQTTSTLDEVDQETCGHYEQFPSIMDEELASSVPYKQLQAPTSFGPTPSFDEQTRKEMEEGAFNEGGFKSSRFGLRYDFLLVIFHLIGGLALPYIKPWSIQFGIPAICTLVATLVFLIGSSSYKRIEPEGSPLTTVFRVWVASASKIFHPLPQDADQLHHKDDHKDLVHTKGLGFLDKAAIILPNRTQEEQEKNRWKLCSVSEVEEAKVGVRLIPMWMTFILIGTVTSIGNTYFNEEANHLNPKIGLLKLNPEILLSIQQSGKIDFLRCFFKGFMGNWRLRRVAIAMAMVFSILCCITAAAVEKRRLNVVQSHGLIDKPEERIPMSMFWLSFQFYFLGATEGIFEQSVFAFFVDETPRAVKNYLGYFAKAITGLGTMASVLTVFVVGKISERGGRPNWFQDTLNKSRLDRYYWTLSAMSAVNIVFFVLMAVLLPHTQRYRRRKAGSRAP